MNGKAELGSVDVVGMCHINLDIDFARLCYRPKQIIHIFTYFPQIRTNQTSAARTIIDHPSFPFPSPLHLFKVVGGGGCSVTLTHH